MSPLTSQNIESELSYAYIHTIASRAGMSCKVAGRHDDNAGVDAEITGWGPFPGGGFIDEVDLKVQLKATVKQPPVVGDCFSYNFKGIKQYDDLRKETTAAPRILVVLFLPAQEEEWIAHSEGALLLRKCAYWVSLRGAKASSNETSQTVYIPKKQRFDVKGLRDLMASISRNEPPYYSEGVTK
ncbi:DUF4365 domain-containing protein [Sinorhizobium meliloti]|nr:DUF4365 domain-containing protein [Sinorhizobium meliloti]RVK93386.1 DUF4365 domain-containing protein [Sinorhizobium meliloti]